MKGLIPFQGFDSMAFFKDKLLKVLANGPLTDYATKQVIGTKTTVVIVEDNTVYHTKTGEKISNLYEKINVKVPNKALDLAPGTLVELVDPKCVIYGEYRNQLSVTAADIRVLQSSGKA